MVGLGQTGTAIKVQVRRGDQTVDYELRSGVIDGFDTTYELEKENYRTFLMDNYPDVKVSVKKLISEGDIVACFNECRGTDSDFNREVIWSESVFYRLSDGKIVEEWYVSDNVSVLQQLGYNIKAPEA